MGNGRPRVYTKKRDQPQRQVRARTRDVVAITNANIKEVASLKLAAVAGGDARRAKPSFRERLGEYLARSRMASGTTQAVAATVVGISLKYYGDIERGDANVTMGVLEAIADMLQIDLCELFSLPPTITEDKRLETSSAPITEGVRLELLQNAEIVAARADEMTRWLKAIAPHERQTPSQQ